MRERSACQRRRIWNALLLAACGAACCKSIAAPGSTPGPESTIYVCPTGSDDNPGTADRPVRTPERAGALAGPGMAVHFLPAQRHLYVSPAGDDTNSGEAARPFKSIGKAVAGAGPGTIVHVSGGIYGPFKAAGLSGSPENPIVIRGEAPLPLDFTEAAAMSDTGTNRSLAIQPIRKALRDGKFSIAREDGLAVIDGQGKGAVTVQGCTNLIVENLVIRRTSLGISGYDVTLRNCALHSGGGVTAGGSLVRLERVVSYSNGGGGFALHPGPSGTIACVECVAHDNGRTGRQDGKSQGDGFSSGDKKIGGIRLLRCLSLGNWSDGFDFKGGDGLVFEYCVGDGNGDLGYGFKDFKVWSGGSVIIRSRASRRALFVAGTHELRDFKTDVPDPDSGKAQPESAPEPDPAREPQEAPK